VKVHLLSGSSSSMTFNMKQLAKFIRAYKAHRKDHKISKGYIEWLMLASTECVKSTFADESVMSITITDKARKCLEK